MNVIGFHNPDEEYGFLSNWYMAKFTLNGIKFSSMEQYMMYKKALIFHDAEIANEVLKTDDVSAIKALGRKVRNYDEHVWDGVRQIIIYQGLCAKFSQNEELKTALCATGSAILAECAASDLIWGIGLRMTDSKRLNPKEWRGRNLLGYALMLVREKALENSL